MAPRPFECWFGVGQPDGDHSMVWKIWAARKTADLYIAARSMGGAMKASLHASGKRNVGLTSEYVPAPEGQVLEVGLLYVPPQTQWALNYRLAVDRRSSWREGWPTHVKCC